jgi:hypothetical protein
MLRNTKFNPSGNSSCNDELTATVIEAVHELSQYLKANFLLETSLMLIESGEYVLLLQVNAEINQLFHRYGPDVEKYFEVYLRTPNLPKADVARALLARANARKRAGEQLICRAQQGLFVSLSILSLETHSSIRFPNRFNPRPNKP